MQPQQPYRGSDFSDGVYTPVRFFQDADGVSRGYTFFYQNKPVKNFPGANLNCVKLQVSNLGWQVKRIGR